MQFLFLKNKKETEKLDGVHEIEFFNNGMANEVHFKNGWPCKICGCVTEHCKIDGAQVCSVCKTAKVPNAPTAQFLDYKAYLSTIRFYSDKIEWEAIEAVFGFSEGDERGVADWVQVRSQLHSNKILEEVIKNARF